MYARASLEMGSLLLTHKLNMIWKMKLPSIDFSLGLTGGSLKAKVANPRDPTY